MGEEMSWKAQQMREDASRCVHRLTVAGLPFCCTPLYNQ